MDWEWELQIAQFVKRKISDVDVGHLWENTLPESEASEEALRSLEARLGYSLNSQHRTFLLHANGWRAFKQHVDVFGVDDILDGPRATRAAALIESLEDIEALCGFGKPDLLPIAAASDGVDLMVMTCPHTTTPGKVLWLASGLIGSFAGFNEWFLAMVDCNRHECQRLAKMNGFWKKYGF